MHEQLDNTYVIMAYSQGRFQKPGLHTMHTATATSTHHPMAPDEHAFFTRLGSRIADARKAADLTQIALADVLGISQPQLASYEVGRRRVPVSMLPRLAKLLSTTMEALIGNDDEDGCATPATAAERRTRRGPPSRLEQQLNAVNRLPRARQRFVVEMLDTLLAQHVG
jgi:transcriptional regulator with XRE-family HTH domain